MLVLGNFNPPAQILVPLVGIILMFMMMKMMVAALGRRRGPCILLSQEMLVAFL